MKKPRKEKIINVTVRLIPHPEPKRVIDLFARIVLEEYLKREEEALCLEKE